MHRPTKTFIVHTDPGHGWIAVKRKLLIELEILDKITSYSYQKGNTVYLEEDVDATTFIEAYIQKYGNKPTQRVSYQEHSPIRYYESFRNQD